MQPDPRRGAAPGTNRGGRNNSHQCDDDEAKRSRGICHVCAGRIDDLKARHKLLPADLAAVFNDTARLRSANGPELLDGLEAIIRLCERCEVAEMVAGATLDEHTGDVVRAMGREARRVARRYTAVIDRQRREIERLKGRR